MGTEPWRVLIVDDEPPIRSELKYLIEGDARVGSITEAGNVAEATERVLVDRPDVLFLDIQMPGRSGMDLAETLQGLKNPPAVVFVTAFAEYAADSYDLDAVDYVLKPVETSRLEKALNKVEAALASRRVAEAPQRPKRLAVERGGKRAFIPVADVCYIEAKADYSRVVCPGAAYMVNESISSLEANLANEGFVRVHRSYLVNLDDVREVELSRGGLMELKLERVEEAVPVSRRRMAEVKRQLGLA